MAEVGTEVGVVVVGADGAGSELLYDVGMGAVLYDVGMVAVLYDVGMGAGACLAGTTAVVGAEGVGAGVNAGTGDVEFLPPVTTTGRVIWKREGTKIQFAYFRFISSERRS